MLNYKVTLVGGTGWYLVVLGHYTLVLVGTWWYRVSVGLFMPIYIEEKNWPGVTNPSQTHRQQNIELLSLSKV